MGEYRVTPLEKIQAISRGDKDAIEALTNGDVSELAAEIVRLRRERAGDSRRADQLRKLRWAIEATHAKIEGIVPVVLEDEVSDRIATAFETRGPCSEHTDTTAIATWIRELKWR
jgi:hypothetical protein